MLSVIAAVGQAEREAMLERQQEAIAQAKVQGRCKGVCRQREDRLSRDHPPEGRGDRPSEIAIRLGIARASVYRVLASEQNSEQVAAYGHADPKQRVTAREFGPHRSPRLAIPST